MVDLKDGFHYLKISEESVKYLSFITPLGQYEYLYLPFGTKIGPRKFQKFINTVFKDLILSGNLVAYMDDLLICTKTLQKYCIQK